jgi:hypothetical protein
MKPDYDPVLFDFAVEYGDHPEQALRRLQLLLLDEQACQSRIAFLQVLAEMGGGGAPLPQSADEFRHEIDLIAEHGVFAARRHGLLVPERLARLTCTPAALWAAHQRLTAAAEEAAPSRLRLLLRPWRRPEVLCAAAALLFFVLWLLRLGSGPAPPPLAATVIDWQLDLGRGGSRAPASGVPIVHTGGAYTVRFRVASPRRRHGWLFQVDARAGHLLDRLKVHEDGVGVCRYSGTFDDTVGFEYFILVLSESPVPALDDEAVPWLGAEDIRQLQEHARAGQDAEAARLVETALRRAGWRGQAGDVRLEWIDHRP